VAIISYVTDAVCDACGVEQKCLRIGLDTISQPIDLCALDLARALQEVSGFKTVNMYRTWIAQSSLKDNHASYRTRVVLPKRKGK